jgi:tripartite ATP-independent transporter DctP family solute receptor
VITRRDALLGLVSGAIATPRPLSADDAARVMTAADVHVAKYPTVEAVRWIGEQLAAATGDRLGIRVYHSGQLGREQDTIEFARFGAIDFTRVNFAALNNAFPLTRVAALPYVFDSVAHMRRAMDGEPGRRILEGFTARGLVGLCIYDSGVRCVYNVRRPIHVPADLHGLKIRVPPSDIFIDIGLALGANATPLAFGEVYSSLQTHLIDGAENNIRSFHSSRQFEVARYWSETDHSYSPEALLVSRHTLDRLGADERRLLTDLAAQSVPYMRQLWDTAEAQSRTAVLEAGVAINEVDRGAFVTATAPLLERWLDSAELRDLYDSIRSMA